MLRRRVFRRAYLGTVSPRGYAVQDSKEVGPVKPVYETQFGQLYQGDCLDPLAETADDTFDLVFADPPFNLGKDYGKTISDSLQEEEYLAWCESWVKECVRTLKPG